MANNVGRPRKREELKRRGISVSLPGWMLEKLHAKAEAMSSELGEEISASRIVETALRSHCKFEFKPEAAEGDIANIINQE